MHSAEMPFYIVQHAITDGTAFAANVAPALAGLPNMDPINEELHKKGMHQHSMTFPLPHDENVKVGWCVFETPAGSDWTAQKIKEWQDEEKKGWAEQDVYEISIISNVEPYYK